MNLSDIIFIGWSVKSVDHEEVVYIEKGSCVLRLTPIYPQPGPQNIRWWREAIAWKVEVRKVTSECTPSLIEVFEVYVSDIDLAVEQIWTRPLSMGTLLAMMAG